MDIDIIGKLLELLALLAPLVIGIGSSYLFGIVKKAVAFIDRQSVVLQQALMVVQMWLIGLISQLLSIEGLPEMLSAFTLDTTEIIAGSLFGLIYHAARKAAGR